MDRFNRMSPQPFIKTACSLFVVLLGTALFMTGCSSSEVAPALTESTESSPSSPRFFDRDGGGGETPSTLSSESGWGFIDDEMFLAVAVDVPLIREAEGLAAVDWTQLERFLGGMIGPANSDLKRLRRVWMVMDRQMVDGLMSSGGGNGANGNATMFVFEFNDRFDLQAVPVALENGAKTSSQVGVPFALPQSQMHACALSESQLAIGDPRLVSRTGQSPSAGKLSQGFAAVKSDSAIHVAIDFSAVATFINSMAQLAREFGADEEFKRVAAITSIEVMADLEGDELLKLLVDVSDPEAVNKLAQSLNEAFAPSSAGGLGGGLLSQMGGGLGGGLTGGRGRLEMLKPQAIDAAGAFMKEIGERELATTTKTERQVQLVVRRAKSFDALLTAAIDDVQRQVALARRTDQIDKVARAVERYFQETQRLPVDGPVAISEDRPTTHAFSWRVHLLPQLGQQELFDRFHFDEPWDSEHNREVALAIPEVFSMNAQDEPNSPRTRIRSVNGPKGVFEAADPLRLETMTDARNRTALFIEVSPANGVSWTAPDPALPLKDLPTALGDSDEQGVLFVDGEFRLRGVRREAGPLEAVLTCSGGESMNRQDLISIEVPDRK